MTIIPLGTPVEVRSKIPGEPARKARVVFKDQEDDEPPLYTVEFDDSTTVEHVAEDLILPDDCRCGTPLQDVCLIPGTDSCMGCHELRIMETTGTGVVLYAPGLGAYMR